MWKDLDMEQLEREENEWAGPRSSEEVEQIVVSVRLELYNKGLPCGPKAMRENLDSQLSVKPLPSERTIARILARNGLTHGRTGWYEAEDPGWLPEAARRLNPYYQEEQG